MLITNELMNCFRYLFTFFTIHVIGILTVFLMKKINRFRINSSRMTQKYFTTFRVRYCEHYVIEFSSFK